MFSLRKIDLSYAVFHLLLVDFQAKRKQQANNIWFLIFAFNFFITESMFNDIFLHKSFSEQ